jgi:hypothetical protein
MNMEFVLLSTMKFLRWVSPENFQRTALNLIKFNARIPMNHQDKEVMDKMGLDTAGHSTFGLMLPRKDQEYVFLFVVPPIDLRAKEYRHIQ